jgi:hypothetical protein
VMDWTHLRFFSYQGVRDLLEASGFVVDRILPEYTPKLGLANSLTLGAFKNFLSYAYNFSALKVTSDSKD